MRGVREKLEEEEAREMERKLLLTQAGAERRREG